jgi:hypothetical protein
MDGDGGVDWGVTHEKSLMMLVMMNDHARNDTVLGI